MTEGRGMPSMHLWRKRDARERHAARREGEPERGTLVQLLGFLVGGVCHPAGARRTQQDLAYLDLHPLRRSQESRRVERHAVGT